MDPIQGIFLEYCGHKFHFSIPFMIWMKNNCGKTLEEAVAEWNMFLKYMQQFQLDQLRCISALIIC
jgi:Domain of unknown function (DUF6434)